jgi:multiple sugar transport system permease protein
LVVFLFAMVWNWNETYMTDTFLAGNIPLLPAMLDRFDAMFSSRAPMAGPQGGEARISEAYKMAGTLIAILPLLILYAFVQKRFIAGIENTGVTGE